MAETPGSNADLSVNGTKMSAPKDKACPFCQQNFTSSSLGRHLDLYIKEKNPKPADGIHNVDEIRKMRGGITRRQPRNSASRREDSTPAGTPGATDRKSPHTEPDRSGNRSPSIRRDDLVPSDMMNYGARPSLIINGGTWESTGVMNDIPLPMNGDSLRSSWDGEDSRDGGRRAEGRSRSVSKQMLAKTTFEQKQKVMEALDTARAAELALREILGSVRAAAQRIEGPGIFDYDPLTLDFPSLVLHCLPPPPTLYQSAPLATPSSWSVLPPDEPQYKALRKHFAEEFRRFRISISMASTIPHDDLTYPPPQNLASHNDIDMQHDEARAEANELESKLSNHLNAIYAQWTSLSQNKRHELWTLELARSAGRKSEEIMRLKKDKDMLQQELTHSKLQVNQLSRLQQPREFRLVQPSVYPIDPRVMKELGEMGVANKSIGFTLLDRGIHLDQAVEKAIGRWKRVIKEARGSGPGMAAQKPLDGEPALPPQKITQQPLYNPASQNNRTNGNTDALGSDQDADGDADMDDSVEMYDVSSQRAPEAQMAATNFRLSNGNGQGGSNGGGGNNSAARSLEAMENQQCVQGYVRIGV